MKKTFLALLILLMVPLLLTGCGSKEETSNNNSSNGATQKEETKKSTYTLENLKTDFQALDSSVEITKKSAEMVGATEGYGFIGSSCTIEVYKFDTSTEQYKKALKDQKLSMPSMEMEFAATVKDGYAYTEPDGDCSQVISLINKLN